MSEKSSTASGGIGFSGLLAVLFIALKLLKVTEVATWSWWWVLSPIWIGWGLIMAFVAVIVLVAVISSTGGRK
jgi:hypothetical protein